ncbi:hypothetical protein LTR53_014579 [Teratosphaeriaceae sp. CCFEE 6253]|nr:hypothetical protein LTR53_014579 [Teratosphaeriaceae sp. CCFEE 6253]
MAPLQTPECEPTTEPRRDVVTGGPQLAWQYVTTAEIAGLDRPLPGVWATHHRAGRKAIRGRGCMLSSSPSTDRRWDPRPESHPGAARGVLRKEQAERAM